MNNIADIIRKCVAGDDSSFGHIHVERQYLIGTMHGIDFKNVYEYQYAILLLNRLTRRGVLERKHKSLNEEMLRYLV